MLDRPCSEVVWRVLATHSIRQFHPSLPLQCVTVCHHIWTGLYHFVKLSKVITAKFSVPLNVTSSAIESVLVVLLGIKILHLRQSSSSVCSRIYRLFSLFLLFPYIFKDYLFLNFIMYILPSWEEAQFRTDAKVWITRYRIWYLHCGICMLDNRLWTDYLNFLEWILVRTHKSTNNRNCHKFLTGRRMCGRTCGMIQLTEIK
jgi:hypothetical protein